MAKDRKGNQLQQIDFLDSVGIESLDDYFDRLEEGLDGINKWEAEQRRRIEREMTKRQQDAVKDLLRKESQWRRDMLASGIKDEVAMQKAALREVEKERLRLQRETMKKVAEEQLRQLGVSTGSMRRDAQAEREASHKDNIALYEALRALGGTMTEEQKAQYQQVKSDLRAEAMNKALRNTMNNLINSLDKLNGGIDKYASYSEKINARLQGYGRTTTLERAAYGPQNMFGILESRITNAVGVQPYFKTEQILDNLQALVEQGIASNVEQRAFLQTAKDGIATTFDVANGALLRIIRLQQNDSTAARLGMEAYLTRFLNTMFETTEYLTSTFDSVEEALVEASSLMKGTQASTEFEYVVQKWLGSLTSVGMSESTATSIAQAMGQLSSGNIDALGGSGLQNLLVMAASRSGQSFGDLLHGGLNATSANALLTALVRYMGEIGANQSNVVKSQLASTFGLTVSDLVAASNLLPSLGAVSDNLMSYGGMYGELMSQMSSIPQRMNMATMLDNMWSNLEFGLASNIAKNPALAAIWKVTGLIQENTGGINIPFIEAFGTGFDLNTTVENLVKLGVVGVSSLGMIGDLMSGMGSTIAPASILSKLGVYASTSATAISRGSGLGSLASGLGLSESGARTIGTSSGEDIYTGTMAGAGDQAREQVQDQTTADSTANALPDIKTYLTDTLEKHMTDLLSDMDAVVTMMRDGVEVKNDVSDFKSLMF